MKTILSAAVAAAALLAVPAFAHADEANAYASIGYSNVDIDPVNLGAISARIGVKVNPYFGLEGEAQFGVADDDILGTTVELKHAFGVFAVASYPITPNIDVFARVGGATATVDIGGTDANSNGAAYGAGAQYFFDGTNGVRVDYTKYELDADADVWSVSYVRKF